MVPDGSQRPKKPRFDSGVAHPFSSCHPPSPLFLHKFWLPDGVFVCTIPIKVMLLQWKVDRCVAGSYCRVRWVEGDNALVQGSSALAASLPEIDTKRQPIGTQFRGSNGAGKERCWGMLRPLSSRFGRLGNAFSSMIPTLRVLTCSDENAASQYDSTQE